MLPTLVLFGRVRMVVGRNEMGMSCIVIAVVMMGVGSVLNFRNDCKCWSIVKIILGWCGKV